MLRTGKATPRDRHSVPRLGMRLCGLRYIEGLQGCAGGDDRFSSELTGQTLREGVRYERKSAGMDCREFRSARRRKAGKHVLCLALERGVNGVVRQQLLQCLEALDRLGI